MMSCTDGPSLRKQLSLAIKESKYWKERYFLEKKGKLTLISWILGVFGYSVKVDVDKETLSIRIEGRENKEALEQAVVSTIPQQLITPENKESDDNVTLLMEDRVTPADFDDSEDLAGLSLALSEVDVEEEEEDMLLSSSNNNDDGNQPGNIMDILTRDYQEHQGDGGGGQDQQHHHQGPQQYIILKEGSNEGVPIQLDLSSILRSSGGEGGGNGGNVHVFKMATCQQFQSDNSGNGGESFLIENTDDNSNSRLINAQRNSPVVPQKKQRIEQPPTSKSETVSSKDKDGRIFSEFGLTLREKAELYVQTCATQAIKKLPQGSNYVCTECNIEYAFSSVQNALSHARSHFEDRAYQCPLCEEAFALQKDFLKHRKEQHSKLKKNKLLNSKSKKVVLPQLQKDGISSHTPQFIVYSNPNKTT